MTLQDRLKYLVGNHNKNKHNSYMETEDANRKRFFTIPYVPSISERFNIITKHLDVRLSYFNLNKLHRFIKVHKDPVPKSACSNVVYKIECENCDASYVGQTSRQLHTRIKKHRNHIRQNTSYHSVITDHRLHFNHDFKWNDVRILDREPIYNKCLISEMIYIKRQDNVSNLQTDTDSLHEAYVNTINKLPNV